MADLKFRCAKVVDRQEAAVWSQVHVFSPQEAKKISRRGQLMAVFTLSRLKEGEESVVDFGRELITRFHEEYYGSLGKGIESQLRVAIEKVAGELPSGLKLSLAAAVYHQKSVYLGLKGAVSAYLKRDQKVGLIGQGEGVGVKVVSGSVQPEDWLVVGTSEFFNLVGEELETSLINSVDEAGESLRALVYARSQGLSAGLVGRLMESEGAVVDLKEPVVTLANRRRQKRLRTGRVRFQLPSGMSLGGAKKKGLIRLLVGLVVFLGLVAGGWGIWRRQVGLKNEAQKPLWLELQAAEDLLGSDPVEAQSRLARLEPEIVASQDEALQEAFGRVLGLSATVDKVSLREVFDYQSLVATVSPESFVFAGSEAWVADASREFWLWFNPDSGRGEPVQIDSEVGRFGSFAHSPRWLYATSKEGVWREERGDWSLVIERELEGESLLAVFNESLYLMEVADWEIYRFSAGEEGFGEPRRWLQEAVKKAVVPVRMAIDGRIWVLDESGQIFVLNQGLGEEFRFDPPTGQPVNLIDLALSGNQERVYLLDENKPRVLVYTQAGEFVTQYTWAESVRPTQLAVDSQESRLWLLVETKIYELELE